MLAGFFFFLHISRNEVYFFLFHMNYSIYENILAAFPNICIVFLSSIRPVYLSGWKKVIKIKRGQNKKNLFAVGSSNPSYYFPLLLGLPGPAKQTDRQIPRDMGNTDVRFHPYEKNFKRSVLVAICISDQTFFQKPTWKHTITVTLTCTFVM